MISKIGAEVLQEMTSELDEDLENRNSKIIVEQGFSIFGSLGAILDKAIMILLFTVVSFILLVLFAIDEESLILMFEATPHEIISGIGHLFQMSCLISFFITTIYLFLRKRKTFIDIKEEERCRNDEKLEKMKSDIELIEEVLYRHGVIKGTENE